MCGILLSKSNSPEKIDSISHRGIESNTIEIGGVILSHHRLPIQTLEKDNWTQPIEISDGIYLMFNGEIFNYNTDTYSSDTEYLSHLFSTYKSDSIEAFAGFFLPHIISWDGFWSILIYNSKSGNIIAFTDPLGKKCLYMNNKGEICSEIKGLKTNESKIDYSYISSIRKWGYNKDNRTPYEEIKRIIPNTIIGYNIDSPEFITEYKNYYTGWNRPIDELRGKSYEDHINWLWDKVYESVNNRLLSNGQSISLLTSGGLDSSIIAAILNSIDAKVKWYSIENGETEFVNELSKKLDTSINFLDYKMEDLENKEIYEKWNETPVDLGSVIPQYYLFKAIKEGTDHRIVLSGDGADELFGGYSRIHEYDSQRSDIFEELSYYHLPRLDKMSMAHTLELRSPFLNLDIVRFALHLPMEWRTDKKILKDTFGPILPNSILSRKKIPLKNPDIIENKLEYRQKVIDMFLSK